MDERPDGRDDRAEDLARLKRELADALARIPAHTIRPHQIQAIEELEERIASLEAAEPR